MDVSHLLIKPARIIDGTGAEPLSDASILVTGDRIESVFRGPVPDSAIPPQTRVLDFPTGTLLPGLIDSHVHLDLPGDGTLYLDSVSEPDGVLVAGATHRARVALESGITTLRDTGGRGSTTFELRRAQRLGHCVGADLLLCGQPITITGGHTWHFGGEADGVEGVRRKVREMVKLGADFIKVMGSGGGTPGTMSWLPSFTPEELRAIADEAHRLERKVTVHCLCAASIENAIDAGVDQIEHAGFIVDAAGRQRFDPALAEKLARAGIPVTSTLAVGEEVLAAMARKDRLTEEEVSFRDRWERMREDNVTQVGALHASGVPFVAGTDAGWRLTPFDALPREVGWLEQAGLSASEALVSATGGAAAVLGIEGRTGAVREGLTADLLVLDGDPLQSLARLGRPSLVVQGGVVRRP
ncbi:MAG: amidohydrolase family protein, partial [Candidatus Dormibacteraceae bacterium]